MENFDGEICETKIEKAIKFNKHYNALNYFVLKNNELCRRTFRVGQPEKLVIYDYNVAKMLKKIHA